MQMAAADGRRLGYLRSESGQARKWESGRSFRKVHSHFLTCSLSHLPFRRAPRHFCCCAKIKRAGSILTPPARVISTKNKHLLAIYSIPARGFTAAVSVFWGTPPPKPLKCKSVSNHLGARLRSRWAKPTGGKPRLSCPSSVALLPCRFRFPQSEPKSLISLPRRYCGGWTPDFVWHCQTSSRRHSIIVHSQFTFRCCHLPSVSGKQKTPLAFRQAGLKNPISIRLPANHNSVQFGFGLLRPIRPGQAKAKRTTLAGPIMTCLALRDRRRPTRG